MGGLKKTMECRDFDSFISHIRKDDVYEAERAYRAEDG